MAEQCTESSVATSSSAANWWPDVHPTSLTSWTAFANPNSNSSREDDVSGLSIESSRRLVESASTNEINGEAVSDNHHLWSHLLLSMGTSGDLQNTTDVGDSILHAFSSSSKNLSTGLMFEPACDYLKKIENGWEFTSPTSLNNFQKNINGFNDGLYQSNKNPALFSNWSIAPPEAELNHQFDPYSDSGTYTCHDMTGKNEHREADQAGSRDLFGRAQFGSGGVRYQEGLINNAAIGDNAKYYRGISDLQSTNGRNFADVVTFGSSLSGPFLDINTPKPMLKASNLSDHKKPPLQTSYPPIISKCNTLTKGLGMGHGITNEGKRRKSEDNSGTPLKKPKHENSTVSSTKVQIPKAKLGDKITALQQIVSPFGKTDTASVLWEAIGYIKCLQEQVQLLCNPYMKTNAIKDPWGGLERKDRGDIKLDLKSRGLCLVPISCTPQVYHENIGSDYWTPTYRGCFYR